MWRVAGKLGRWPSARGLQGPAVLYEVACRCGAVARGLRSEGYQVVPCPACGRKVFILPLSPLPAPSVDPSGPPRPPGIRNRVRVWLWPVAAAGLTLAIIVPGLAFLWQRHLGSARAAREAHSARQHMGAGRAALAQGKFLVAVRELESAQQLGERHPEALSPAERRELAQLRRQAALLADLLPESLADILHHAAELTRPNDQEWRQVFAERYRGKAVVFDAEVRRDAAGTYDLDYAVFIRGRRARLDLGDVELLRFLPLGQTHRLLIGLRLAAALPEAEGSWVLRFEPGSAVLLTDLDAAAGCCGLPAEELAEVVNCQRGWLAQMPSPESPPKRETTPAK